MSLLTVSFALVDGVECPGDLVWTSEFLGTALDEGGEIRTLRFQESRGGPSIRRHLQMAVSEYAYLAVKMWYSQGLASIKNEVVCFTKLKSYEYSEDLLERYRANDMERVSIGVGSWSLRLQIAGPVIHREMDADWSFAVTASEQQPGQAGSHNRQQQSLHRQASS